eukprot:7007647-Karenia_brevis.AAC.1
MKAELQDEMRKSLTAPLTSFEAVLAAKKEMAAMRLESMSVDSNSSAGVAEACLSEPAKHVEEQSEQAESALMKQLADDTLEDCRSRLISIDRQIAALKDLQDSRSVSAVASLKREAKAVRNAITLKKPPSERVATLEEALVKKREALKAAEEQRVALVQNIRDLKIDINNAEVELERAKRAVTEELGVDMGIKGEHYVLLHAAASQVEGEEAMLFQKLLCK